MYKLLIVNELCETALIQVQSYEFFIIKLHIDANFI